MYSDSSASGSHDTITVVTSTSIWGDVAASVTDDDRVEIDPVITGTDVDPHHFEPTATDLARAEQADLVVVGGGGYDAWLYEDMDESKVIHALDLTPHSHDHGDPNEARANGPTEQYGPDLDTTGNEHIWYDTVKVTEVAQDLAAKITELNPDIEVDASALTEEMDTLRERVEALPELRVAQTEPIGDYLIKSSHFTEVTPPGYRQSTINESEPAAADLAQFLDLIENHGLDLLIYNPQTETDMTEQIRAAAEAADIPIVEISETPPEGVAYFDYFHQVIDNLEQGAAEAATTDSTEGSAATTSAAA